MVKRMIPGFSNFFRAVFALTFTFLFSNGQLFGQSGFSSYGFANGSPQTIVVCENSSAINIDTLLKVADPNTGDTDTWSVLVSPRGTLVAATSAISSGSGSVLPTGRTYTPPTGYVGHDTFKVKVKDGHLGDSDETVVYVTINPLPFVSAISGASSVCVDATTRLTDTATTGSWYSTVSADATVSSSGVVTGSSAGTDVILYVKTNSCGSDTARLTMTVNPLAMPGTISGADSLCPGNMVTFRDGVSGGVWSSTNTTLATVSSTGVVTVLSGGIDTIKYSVTNICGTISAIYPFTIVPTPYAGVITGLDSVCAGSAIVLSDAVSDGTWSSASTRIAIVESSGVVIGVNAGVDSIKYTYTNSCGTNYTTHFVRVIPLPYAGGIGGVDTVCPGSTVTLADTISVGAGSWSSLDPGIALVNDSGKVTGVSGGIDTIVYTATTTCGTTTTEHIMNVYPIVYPGTITGSSTVCQSASLTLSDSITGGTWISVNGAIATIDGSGLVTGLAAGVDTIVYSVSSVFCDASTMFSITVLSLPAPGAITGAATICRGDSTTLTDTAHGGMWSSLYDTVVSVNDSGMIKALSWGMTTISYTDTYNCGVTYGTLNITVDTFPLVSVITGAADSLCPGKTVTLSDSIASGSWSSIYTAIATVASSGIVTGVATGVDTIKYTVTNVCGSAIASYFVWVKNDSECTNGVKTIIDQPDAFTIYPNPGTGLFYARFNSSGNSDCQVQITNIIGEKVKEQNLRANKETEIQLNVSPGVYFVCGVVNGVRVIQQIVVE